MDRARFLDEISELRTGNHHSNPQREETWYEWKSYNVQASFYTSGGSAIIA